MPFYSNAVFRFGLTPDVAARYTLLQSAAARPVRMRLANGARDRRRLERLAIGRLGIAGELALGVDFGDIGVALAEVLEAVHLELERRADAALV
eukprot:scaffold31724_cov59-Phaeocystis_antarctica.AAC.2